MGPLQTIANRTQININTKWWLQRVTACCMMVAVCASQVEGAQQRWHSDLSRAAAEAKQLNKPLIIHFYADWCGPCKKMDRNVLHSTGLLRQFGTRFVGVKLNSDHNQKLAARLGINSLPSDVFVHPDGWVIQKSSGSKNLRGYFSQLAQIETKFHRIEQMKLAKNKTEKGPLLTPFIKTEKSPFQAPDRNEPKIEQPKEKISKLRLQTDKQPTSGKTTSPKKQQGRLVGLSAFSPVTLKDKHKWVRGNRQFSETYMGITYYMRSHTEVQRFKAAPERYVPRYLGCDAVILKQQQQAIAGSTRFAAFYGNGLYLFAKPITRKEFKKHPDQFSKIKNNVTVDNIRH